VSYDMNINQSAGSMVM